MGASELDKVVVHIPNHWFLPAESLWAQRLGRARHQIKNIPFFAYDLNLDDVVRTVREEDSLPVVRAVAARSGNQTLRVIFDHAVPVARRATLLAALKPQSVTFEGFDDKYFALNVADPARFAEVEAALVAHQRQGLLSYETCEARVAGSFDAAPSNPTRSTKRSTKKRSTKKRSTTKRSTPKRSTKKRSK